MDAAVGPAGGDLLTGRPIPTDGQHATGEHCDRQSAAGTRGRGAWRLHRASQNTHVANEMVKHNKLGVLEALIPSPKSVY